MTRIPDGQNLINPVMLATYRLARHRSTPEELATGSADRLLNFGQVSLVLLAMWIGGGNRVTIEV